jgi:hypothetical protein
MKTTRFVIERDEHTTTNQHTYTHKITRFERFEDEEKKKLDQMRQINDF